MPDFTTEELPLSVTEDLVPSTAPKPACTTSIDFDGLLGTPLLLQDDPTECGGQLWPGGMVLAKYLLRCKTAELEGKTMFVFVRHTRLLPLRPETAKKSVADLGGNSLELGAGSGLVGLALSLHPLRPSQIHLTDLPTIVPLLTLNIALNSPPTPTTAHVLNWGAPIPNTIPSPPDILLAADCVYFEPAFPLLLQTMRELIGPDTICYLCFKKRRRADMGFVKMARKVFEVRAVEDDPDGEVWGREGVHLYEIRCKQKASPG